MVGLIGTKPASSRLYVSISPYCFKPGAVFPVSEGSLPLFASSILGEVGDLEPLEGIKTNGLYHFLRDVETRNYPAGTYKRGMRLSKIFTTQQTLKINDMNH
jgi:hypothetical protein